MLTPVQYDNPEANGPAGSVHLSIYDWAKFIALWFSNQTPAILDRAALDELMAPGSTNDLGQDYAAGWAVADREWADGTALWHDGSNGVWRTVLWIAPDRGIAYLAAANAADIFANDTITGCSTTLSVVSSMRRLFPRTPHREAPKSLGQLQPCAGE